MNTSKKIMDLALGKISFSTIQKYLSNKNWRAIPIKREDLFIWHWGNPTTIEILLPLDRTFADYDELMIQALGKIALAENRDIEQVINDFLLPPSDIIKFKVNNKKTENGLITFNACFTLLENAKKSLFATACDIVNPTSYHQRMSYKKAQQFIDSCFFGQTERGSFVASVICPFINTTEDEKPSHLSQYTPDEFLVGSFTRTVTKKYMNSLLKIKQTVKSKKFEIIDELADSDTISGNFIESLLELGEYGENGEVEIITSWSPILREKADVPNVISLTKDFIAPLEFIASKLKPQDVKGIDGEFIGKISRAQADPDPCNRTVREITFKFVGNEDKLMTAKVLLPPEDFSEACKALDKGLNVKISGSLMQYGKTKVINNPVFQFV